MTGAVLLHDIVIAMGRDGQLSRTISRMSGQELLLIVEHPWWPDVAVRFVTLMPSIDCAIEVESVPMRIHAVEAIRRVMTMTVDGRTAIPRGEADARVLVAVVVAVVEAAAAGPHEQVDQEARHVDRVARLVAGRTTIPITHERPAEPHWREQCPAPSEPVVHVPRHIHTTTRGPGVLIGDPHVLLVTGHVVPRRPLIVVRDIGPVPRHPDLIVTRGRHIRPDLQRLGRLWNVGQLLRLHVRPEPGDKLEPALDLRPIP